MNMIRKIIQIFLVLAGITGCNDPYKDTVFVNEEEMPTGAYLSSREGEFSEWIAVLNYADMFNAINQASETFTVFVPTNEAVQAFYTEMGVSSIRDFSTEYARELAYNHIINASIDQKTFLVGGRLNKAALSTEYFSITYAGEAAGDQVQINGVEVKELANETTNGFVYVLKGVIKPITETLYDRIAGNEYKLFRQAVDATGWNKRLSTVYDTIVSEYGTKAVVKRSFTLFPVTDEVFKAEGITSFEQLVSFVAAADNNYTSTENALNQYVGYHMVNSLNFAEDLFAFTATDSILVWNTQATNQVIISSKQEDGNYLNYAPQIEGTDTTYSGIQLVNPEAYQLAKNGVMHPVNAVMPVYQPTPVTTYWDFCDYPELESIINTWGDENGYGICYQQYLFDQKGKFFPVDITSYGLDFFQYTETSHNYNYPSVAYCVLGNLKDAYKVNYFGDATLAGGAYKDDVLLLNLGYMGKITFTTPTIIKGKYKIVLHYAKDGKQYNMFSEGLAKCKFTLDYESTEAEVPGTDVVNTNNGIIAITLWDTVEFSETGTHEFSIVLQDPRASTYNKFYLMFDYVSFEPVN